MGNASVQADLIARQRALNVDGSFIVQAPAGSGKTELLIQRFLSLLALVEHPEEVLAITFTKKAAAEMRLRVTQALAVAASEEAPEVAHAKQTYELARQVLAQDGKRGWRLQQNPGRLRIQTLDALNAQISRMQPLTTAAATTGNVVLTESGIKEIYFLAAASTLDHLVGDSPYAASVKAVLTHLDNDSGRYIRHIADMLGTRDQWLPLIGVQKVLDSSAIRQQLEDTLGALVHQQLAEISNVFPAEQTPELLDLLAFAAEHLDDGNSAIRNMQFEHELPAAGDLSAWQTIADLLLKVDGSFRQSVNVNQGFPPGKGKNAEQKARFKELTATLEGARGLAARLQQVRHLPLPAYPDAQWAVLEALLQLLILASAELQRLFQIRGSVDYIEIAMNAKSALGTASDPGHVALLLDYGLSHILVDEMQDTSIAQYDFVKMLVAGWTPGDGRTLFCVGDPMQSVYRFRNAEVAQFLQARKHGIGDVALEPLVLEQNFRSGSTLVDWFNAAFTTIFSDRDEPNQGAVKYSQAIAAEHLHGEGEVVCHPVLGTSPGAEAERTAEAVAGLLHAHPNENVTVLVRSRSQVQELIPMLRQRKLEFSAVDIDRLTDLPEVIDLLSLTRAATHAGDRLAWLALLRAPWIGLSWSDLHALVSGDRNTPVWSLLHDDARLACLSEEAHTALKRGLPILQALFAESRFASLSERVESAWYALAGPALLETPTAVENAHRFLSLLRSFESAGTLRDVAILEEQLEAERASTVSDARLQIMTMHKSKGLQFDHVVLHGIGRRSRASSKSLLSWLEAVLPGSDSPVLAPIKPTEASADDPIYRYIRGLNKQKDDYEKQRLLYVAATRAKRSLHLVGNVAIDAEKNELEAPPAGTLLSLLWPLVAQHWEAAHAAGQTVLNRDDGAQWLTPVRRVVPGNFKPTPSVPPPMTQTPVAAEATAVQFEWAGQAAKVAGTIVHRWLHHLVEQMQPLSALTAKRRKQREEHWLREEGIEGADREFVLERVAQALASMQQDPKAEWILHGPGEAELGISGFFDGQLVTGVIDRVRIDAEQHWIIDYKTGIHEGGGIDAFFADEKRRYSEQLRKYQTLYEGLTGVRAKTALYYPLMAKFVEIDLNDNQ